MVKKFVGSLKAEFKGYNAKKFGMDVLSGVTVAAVALPLALAFGVSSGASAAAGLITAIIAGIVIGGLSGGSYQISGPTGAMTAILVSLVAQYGLKGVFIACFLSGIILLIAGLLKLGGLVSFIPLPVIAGFTSGIAIIIAFGQIDNATGLKGTGLNNIEKLLSYFMTPQTLDITALVITLAVIVFMIVYPQKANAVVPSSLVAIILATIVNLIFKFDVASVGSIPKTIFLEERLEFSMFSLETIKPLIVPAFSIAALGLIESLLCGASAGRMKNEKLDADRELVAQGIGNMLIPFFGGVPATAAIARTSVAIKAGGQTRLTSIIHSLVLLLSMFVLGGVMSAIPLAALAGVLIVTAWRMNDWEIINDIFKRKMRSAISQFFITMAATVVFDLTVAIVIGIVFSLVIFVAKISNIQVTTSEVNPEKLADGSKINDKIKNTSVIYVTGPLYFGTTGKLQEKIDELEDKEIYIFSLRGVPLADISGVQALDDLVARLHENNKTVYFTAVQPNVMEIFSRSGFSSRVGSDNFYWSTDRILTELGD
ncbi:MAG: SulP family inorganic anion transporter [Oscillospiraceae bacterium]|nr:SulP family inorganic anion transporter [Oscillospiraceae bacterium]